mgnify:FL=1
MASRDGEIRIGVVLDSARVTRQIDELGDKLSSGMKKGLDVAAKIGKVAAAGVAAATAGVAALTKEAMVQYSEYEQLVGGVETLFKESADTVMGYAENAYKTAGLSANEYMNTVTSFSASLLQSLDNDTAQAAEKANLAITDMADNANKMGTAMESIQNAYQGFAKQNYTMLDNLKLGYGGTKEEMERLLEDAGKLSGIKYDISSFSDIVDAIHVVQTELGITGTTAKEAATTIQGSINATKSAWANLLTGIADENADVEQLVNNLVDSASTAAENIMPRIEQILSGVGELVAKIVPTIAERIPQLISDVLPKLLRAGMDALAGVAQGIGDAMPTLIQCALDAILTFAKGLSQSVPQMFPAVIEIITELAATLLDNIDKIIEAADGIITALIDGLIQGIPALAKAVPKLAAAIIKAFAKLALNFADAGKNIVENILHGLKSAWEKVIAWVKNAVSWIKGIFGGATSSVSSADTGNRSSYNMQAMPALRSVEIPALAKGAVIPANKKFLAVLGDQTRGTNVEAPLDTIQQAVAQTFAEISPQFAQAIVAALATTGLLGDIRDIRDSAQITAAKEFTLGDPSSAVGRWVSRSIRAYEAVRG